MNMELKAIRQMSAPKKKSEGETSVANLLNPFHHTDHLRSIQNNEWKSPLQLLSVKKG